MPAWEVLRRSVKTPLLIDGRNVFDTDPVEAGFTLPSDLASRLSALSPYVRSLLYLP